MSRRFVLSNTSRKQTGTAGTATIYHEASPAADDGYLTASLDSETMTSGFSVLGSPTATISFWSAYGTNVLLKSFGAGLGTVTMKNAVIAAQPAVKVLYTGRYHRFGQVVLVMDNAGSGDSYFQDNKGRNWLVQDIGAGATGLPQLKYNVGNSSFQADLSMGGSNVNIWNNAQDSDNVLISITDTNSAAEAVHINTAGAVTERLVQGSGGDLTFTHVSPMADQYYSPTGNQYVQLYLNETTLGLEHASASLPLSFDVTLPLSNIMVSITYNADAATAGKLLRWSTADERPEGNFTVASNKTTKSSLTLTPSQNVNFS